MSDPFTEVVNYDKDSFNVTEETLKLRTNFASYLILTRLEQGIKPVALLGNKDFSIYIEIAQVDNTDVFSCSIASPQETDLLLYAPTLNSSHLDTDLALIDTMNQFLVRLLTSPYYEMKVQKHNLEIWMNRVVDRNGNSLLGNFLPLEETQ